MVCISSFLSIRAYDMQLYAKKDILFEKKLGLVELNKSLFFIQLPAKLFVYPPRGGVRRVLIRPCIFQNFFQERFKKIFVPVIKIKYLKFPAEYERDREMKIE